MAHYKTIYYFLAGSIILLFIILASRQLSFSLFDAYQARRSPIMYDRNHEIIAVKTNEDDSIAMYADAVPQNFAALLLSQEDKHFYYHLGINPASTLRAFVHVLTGNKNRASSTITQQLVKILLSHEGQRTISNKLMETFGAVALELTTSKQDILTMYANSVYFGNNVQGIESASKLYFGKHAEELADDEAVRLVKTLQNPTSANPFTDLNASKAHLTPFTLSEIRSKTDAWRSFVQSDVAFELRSLGINCIADCTLTVDARLTKTLRDTLLRNLQTLQGKKVDNGAIVILKEPENQLLAIVGSPDPSKDVSGYQLNMADTPRPIGSTVKPLIYLKAFEKGLRPYTLVDDREYRYPIGTGFALYPKNYDFTYHGIVTLHEALSNSYNVPAVKVLEYVGTDNFANFLRNDLHFTPVQPLENYELGIALGELEMPLLNLSYYLSIFANHGTLKPMVTTIPPLVRQRTDPPSGIGEGQGGVSTLPNSSILSLLSEANKKLISSEPYIELVNKILSDRATGVQQFGIKSNLNLPYANYALKTGTSREYHDSWTVGYTPDFLVGVWVGNSDNRAMDGVSGQSGAGNIWSEAMNIMSASQYNKKTPFDFHYVKEFQNGNSLEYGLANDDYGKMQNKLLTQSLITNPHDGDTFLLDSKTTIPLHSSTVASWYVNGILIGHDSEVFFQPKKAGTYTIQAVSNDGKEESVAIFIASP